MSPRVAYWTSAFEADIEAVASEVASLRQAYPESIVWGIGPGTWGPFSWARGFRFHPRMHWVFRGLTRLLQGAFDVNHLFGGLGDWFHLQAVCRHPVVLTVAVAEQSCDDRLLAKVDRFVVEWPGARNQLEQLGIEHHRIKLIFPPVDLSRFHPAPPPDGPFTVLFASSPDRAEWLEARGVHLILKAAALRPEWRFRLIWRPWGDSLPTVRKWIADRRLTNVDVLVGKLDMAAQYHRGHVTIAPFTQLDRCKPVPNSVLEGMASGVPVLVTRTVALANVIEEGKAGVVCDESPEAIVEGLEVLRGDRDSYARRGRCLVEKHFGIERFLSEYDQLYQDAI